MDRTGYSPIDRRTRPSLFALRDSAVSKSWLFLENGQPDEGCLLIFYRIDDAEAEMVHGKSGKPLHIRPVDKIPVTAELFPNPAENRQLRGWRAPPRMTRKAVLLPNRRVTMSGTVVARIHAPPLPTDRESCPRTGEHASRRLSWVPGVFGSC